jgi:uncharacterized protein YgiM (DUF1202 family)
MANKRVSLRERAGVDYRVVGRLEAGEGCTIERIKGDWVRVEAGGRAGWVPIEALNPGRNPPAKRRRAFVLDRSFSKQGGVDAKRARLPDEDDGLDDDLDARRRTARSRSRLRDDEFDDPPPRSRRRAPSRPSDDEFDDPPRSRRRALPRPSDDEFDDPPPRSRRRALPRPSEDEFDDPPPRRVSRRQPADAELQAEPAPPERPRKPKRNVVVAQGKLPLRKQPDKDAPTVTFARDGELMNVQKPSKNGRFLLVELGGQLGWVEKEHVKDPDAVGDDEPASGSGGSSSGGTINPGSAFTLRAQTGFVSLSQSFDSDAGVFLGKYRVASGAAAAAVNAIYAYNMGGFEIGFDGSYRFTLATPGIQIQTMGKATQLTLLEHTLDVGARIGARSTGEGMGTGFYGRLGYHTDLIRIDYVDAAKLPSENVAGVTIGVGLDIPYLSEHLSLAARGDYMIGSRDQTVNLRDGKDAGTMGIFLGLGAGYRFGQSWSADVGYQLSYLATSFTGISERLQGGSRATRLNLDHIVLIGLSYYAR